MTQAKTYRASERGYVDGRLVEPDEVFTTEAPKGAWMEPVKGSEAAFELAIDAALDPLPDDVDLTKLSKPALEALATDRGIPVAGLSQKQLVDAIKAAHDPKR